MQGKKELLSKFMFRANLFRPLKLLRRDMVVIFGWHRVIPDHQKGTRVTPYAEDVLGPTVSELDEAVAWFKHNVDVISEDELIEIVQGKRRPRGLSVMITFDDGYADNYSLAYPVLKRHGVPGIFFVPTKRIEERDLGWVDLIPYAIKHTAKREVSWGGQSFSLPDAKDGAVAYFHKVMQLEQESATKTLLQDLFAQLDVQRPALDRQTNELMTWEQLREVQEHGITVASHTHTHRVLATLGEDDQRDELARSKQILETNLRRKVKTIAYPVGGYRHFNATTQRLAREVGYELAYSYCTGFNRFGAIAPYDVKRIGPPLSLELLAGTTVLPEVFDWETTSAYNTSGT